MSAYWARGPSSAVAKSCPPQGSDSLLGYRARCLESSGANWQPSPARTYVTRRYENKLFRVKAGQTAAIPATTRRPAVAAPIQGREARATPCAAAVPSRPLATRVVFFPCRTAQREVLRAHAPRLSGLNRYSSPGAAACGGAGPDKRPLARRGTQHRFARVRDFLFAGTGADCSPRCVHQRSTRGAKAPRRALAGRRRPISSQDRAHDSASTRALAPKVPAHHFYETAVSQPSIPGTVLLYTSERAFAPTATARGTGPFRPGATFLIIDGQHRPPRCTLHA